MELFVDTLIITAGVITAAVTGAGAATVGFRVTRAVSKSFKASLRAARRRRLNSLWEQKVQQQQHERFVALRRDAQDVISDSDEVSSLVGVLSSTPYISDATTPTERQQNKVRAAALSALRGLVTADDVRKEIINISRG